MCGSDMRIIEVQASDIAGAISGLVDDLMNMPDRLDVIVEVPHDEVESLAEAVELGSATVGADLAEMIRDQAASDCGDGGVEIHVPAFASTGLACLIQSGLERIGMDLSGSAGQSIN